MEITIKSSAIGPIIEIACNNVETPTEVAKAYKEAEKELNRKEDN